MPWVHAQAPTVPLRSFVGGKERLFRWAVTTLGSALGRKLRHHLHSLCFEPISRISLVLTRVWTNYTLRCAPGKTTTVSYLESTRYPRNDVGSTVNAGMSTNNTNSEGNPTSPQATSHLFSNSFCASSIIHFRAGVHELLVVTILQKIGRVKLKARLMRECLSCR
jgi:hypothetical protein